MGERLGLARILRIGFGLSLAATTLPALVTTRAVVRRRAGEEQHARNPAFQPGYRQLVKALDAALPPDAGLLLTPNTIVEASGKSRWYLHL